MSTKKTFDFHDCEIKITANAEDCATEFAGPRDQVIAMLSVAMCCSQELETIILSVHSAYKSKVKVSQWLHAWHFHIAGSGVPEDAHGMNKYVTIDVVGATEDIIRGLLRGMWSSETIRMLIVDVAMTYPMTKPYLLPFRRFALIHTQRS
jgi:hypothetical protein